MLRQAGYYCTYQGKWHLSNAYITPQNPGPTTDALEPYGFSEFNDWGDIDGGAWAGLKIDPVIAGQAVKWLRNRAPVVAPDQPWFMAVNFVNPHDVMSFDYGGSPQVQLPFGLAHAVVARAAADVPLYQRRWEFDLPASLRDDLSGAAPAVGEYARMLDTVFGPVADDQHWYDGLNFYLNAIRDVDRSIELVLDALEASGQADRTVVVFTSDHGEVAGSHGLRQKGNLVYDEFLLCHPDVAGGGRTAALASAVDLAPTLLEFAGLDRAATATRFPGKPHPQTGTGSQRQYLGAACAQTAQGPYQVPGRALGGRTVRSAGYPPVSPSSRVVRCNLPGAVTSTFGRPGRRGKRATGGPHSRLAAADRALGRRRRYQWPKSRTDSTTGGPEPGGRRGRNPTTARHWPTNGPSWRGAERPWHCWRAHWRSFSWSPACRRRCGWHCPACWPRSRSPPPCWATPSGGSASSACGGDFPSGTCRCRLF